MSFTPYSTKGMERLKPLVLHCFTSPTPQIGGVKVHPLIAIRTEIITNELLPGIYFAISFASLLYILEFTILFIESPSQHT